MEFLSVPYGGSVSDKLKLVCPFDINSIRPFLAPFSETVVNKLKQKPTLKAVKFQLSNCVTLHCLIYACHKLRSFWFGMTYFSNR